MPIKTEADLRREIVEIGRRVYDRFLVAANDGNISARLDEQTVLLTPTGVSKGFMQPEDVVKVGLNPEGNKPVQPGASRASRVGAASARSLLTERDVRGVPVGGRLAVSRGALVTPLARQIALERNVTLEEAGGGSVEARRPSSEGPMHLAIYRARPDVQAVVHTHAPAATAFAVTGVRLDEPLLPEVLMSLGPVAWVPYAPSGTEDLPRAMVPYLADHDAFLLANHGAVTVGRSLEEAYFHMERLELFARIRLAVLELGPARALPSEEVARLTDVWQQMRKASL
jgi:L-fuculose-phosphate aldolase